MLGKNVTEDTGGEEREWLERHWRKFSWVGSEAPIETWMRKIEKIAEIEELRVLIRTCASDFLFF